MKRTPWEITREMFLSVEEVESLLEAVRRAARQRGPEQVAGAVDRVIIEGLLWSGLRSSEFCQLRIGDTSIGLGVRALRTRDRKEGRTVYIPRHLDRLIVEYVENVRPRFVAGGDSSAIAGKGSTVTRGNPAGIRGIPGVRNTPPLPPLDRGGGRPAPPRERAAASSLNQPLIVNERGRAYERTGLYRRVVRILETAGLGERASVQLLRHTYGYLAYLRTGGNLLFVQRQLGHAHPMVTAIYAQFVVEDHAALAERVAGRLAKS